MPQTKFPVNLFHSLGGAVENVKANRWTDGLTAGRMDDKQKVTT